MSDCKILGGSYIVTKSGIKRVIMKEVYKGDVTHIVRSTFTKEHPMYKNYGITRMHVHKFPNKITGKGWNNVFYVVESDVYNNKYFFYTDFDAFRKGANKQCAEFLKFLKKVQSHIRTKL